MAQFGDFVDDDARYDLFRKTLVPGRVFVLNVNFTRPPKEKWMLLLTVEAPFLFFVINTWVSKFLRATPALLAEQIGLLQADEPFLDHDSILDCSRIRIIGEAEIASEVVADFGRIKGDICPETRARIIDKVSHSRTLVKRDKKRICDGLGSIH